jgi:hypothetical protein
MRTAPPRREDGTFGVGEVVKPGKIAQKKLGHRFQKGDPKPPTSGRKKGTPNKLKSTLAAKLEERGHDPSDVLIDIATDPEERSDLRARVNLELLNYVYPKRAHLDVTHAVDPDTLNRLLQEGRERVARAKAAQEKQEVKTIDTKHPTEV